MHYASVKKHPVVFCSLLLCALAGLAFLLRVQVRGRSIPEAYARFFYGQCYARNRGSSIEKQICYSRLFKPLTLSRGPTFALAALNNLQRIDAAMGIDCHYIAHAIGRETFFRDPEHWSDYFITFSPVCREGGTHGIFEAYVDTHGLTPETFLSLCDKAETVDGYCYHMAGHVLLAENRGDIDKSLGMCHWLPNTQRRHMCYAAVFMENETAQLLIAHGIAGPEYLDWKARLSTLKDICHRHTGDQAVACWLELGLVYIDVYKSDPAIIYQACIEGAPSEWAGHECEKYAMEILASSLDNAHLGDNARRICEAVPTETLQTECYSHIAITLSNSNPKNIHSLILFCGSLAFRYQRQCYTSLGNFYTVYGSQTSFSPHEWAYQCRAAPLRWQQACATGGVLPHEPNFRWVAPLYVQIPVWNGSGWTIGSPVLKTVNGG